MSKKNKFNTDSSQEITKEVIETDILEETIEEEINDEEVEVEVEEEETPVNICEARVAVRQLYMRKEPRKDADIICVLNDLTPIKVDTDRSTIDFYYVILGVTEGYCMKQFIEVV